MFCSPFKGHLFTGLQKNWTQLIAIVSQIPRSISLFSDMGSRVGIDSGMVVVIFISLMYLTIVFGMLFYVKNDWCDLLFKNFTESIKKEIWLKKIFLIFHLRFLKRKWISTLELCPLHSWSLFDTRKQFSSAFLLKTADEMENFKIR